MLDYHQLVLLVTPSEDAMCYLLGCPMNYCRADEERLAILRTLVMASGGTGLMHESYWFEDSSVYTRFWFAMANSYMGEALLDLAENRPHLLFEGEGPGV
eukprot:COSAG02_NODE_4638_length_5143_cov_2.129064_2_plen_100_part_00